MKLIDTKSYFKKITLNGIEEKNHEIFDINRLSERFKQSLIKVNFYYGNT